MYPPLHANAAVPRPVFTALFLAASAFCNAGFSTLSALDVSGGPASAVPITLSAPGKAMLSLTMLAGRLGLLVIAARMSGRRRSQDGRLMFKQAEVLFGG